MAFSKLRIHCSYDVWLIYLVVLCSAAVASTLNICPSQYINAEPSNTLTVTSSTYPTTSCQIRIGFPAQSWISFSLLSYYTPIGRPNLGCGAQAVFLSIYYPTIQTRTFCGTGQNIPPLFTRYSAVKTEVDAKLTNLVRTSVSETFQISYTVARVIYSGGSGTTEPSKLYDNIVSHQAYSSSLYANNIDSTLTLTGFEIGASLRIQLVDFVLASGCHDYLQVLGAAFTGFDNIILCNDAETVMYLTVISPEVLFRFVSDGQQSARGFIIRYEKQYEGRGCDPADIQDANISYNTTLESFVKTCRTGYHFSHKATNIERITCYRGSSTWSNTEGCSDINECLISNGGCSDVCINTEGSYLCTCPDSSATLLSDGLTCSGSDTILTRQGTDNNNSMANVTKPSNIAYILIGVIVPVAVIVVILIIAYIILRRRNKAFTKSRLPQSLPMSDVNRNLTTSMTPHSAAPPIYAEVKKPPKASRLRTHDEVANEYEVPAPVYEESDIYENEHQGPAHQPPIYDRHYANSSTARKSNNQQQETVDLVENDLYGT